RWNDMMNKIPMGYAGKPEDVGYMIAFLASDEAKYITGEIFNVGGGFRI
ncbi:MAG: SDR family oxidoreductase, partial [Oscillospiraceae bacterium]